MTDFRITKTGEYRTRDGRKAVVLCVDAPCPEYPVVGYIVLMKNGEANTWGINGHKYNEGTIDPDEDDIISEWVEPKSMEYYAFIDSDGSLCGANADNIQEGYNHVDEIGYIKTRLTINPDGTKDIEIIEKVWR